MMDVEPFEVRVPEEDLDDLRARLGRTRWAVDVGNADWRYGVERGWLEEMLSYWRHDFDWRATERRINGMPQFRVEIDGFAVHFVHIRSGRPGARPLLLLHGWPWTFMDFHDMVGPLSDPISHGSADADAFDLVIPSLPGFGFSSALTGTTLGVPKVAEVFATLMRDVLGYEHYGVVGGDFGAVVAFQLARRHPEHVMGVFATTPVIPGLDLARLDADAFAPDEQWMLGRTVEAHRLVASHYAVHAHDPQTLAYALVDSPVGTAAWIWERRRAWSDCDGDILTVHDPDFLCTLASIYWLTGTIGTSLRMYRDNHVDASTTVRSTGSDDAPRRVIDVPVGFAIHPKEVMLAPRAAVAAVTNLQHWRVMPRGGHFEFSEQPAALTEELRAFFLALKNSPLPS